MRSLNEIFRKDVTYDKSHKKPEPDPIFRDTFSEKPQGRGQIGPLLVPPSPHSF